MLPAPSAVFGVMQTNHLINIEFLADPYRASFFKQLMTRTYKTLISNNIYPAILPTGFTQLNVQKHTSGQNCENSVTANRLPVDQFNFTILLL